MAAKKITKMPDRIQVRQEITTLTGYDLEGDINDVIKTLQDVAARGRGGPVRTDWGQHDRWSDSYSLLVYTMRDETDEEYNVRTAEVRQQMARNEEYERKQLAALLAKYPDAVK